MVSIVRYYLRPAWCWLTGNDASAGWLILSETLAWLRSTTAYVVRLHVVVVDWSYIWVWVGAEVWFWMVLDALVLVTCGHWGFRTCTWAHFLREVGGLLRVIGASNWRLRALDCFEFASSLITWQSGLLSAYEVVDRWWLESLLLIKCEVIIHIAAELTVSQTSVWLHDWEALDHLLRCMYRGLDVRRLCALH